MPQDETTAQTVWVMQAWAQVRGGGILSAMAWFQTIDTAGGGWYKTLTYDSAANIGRRVGLSRKALARLGNEAGFKSSGN